MDLSMQAQQFAVPPILRNHRDEVRKAGFELEYAGVDIEQSARLVQQVFGGQHIVKSTFEHRVKTEFGDFQVEIDTSLLKHKKYEPVLKSLGLEKFNTLKLEGILLDTFSTLVPIEIAAPPLPVDQLAPLDELRSLLHQSQAKGTRASILYAFGMHINPEIPSHDPGLLRDYLRAFVLLYPWLKKQAEVDLARSISPYINPFPTDYVRLITREDYPASKDRLIDDFMEHNPTRNRPLDMLPVLACLDQQRVMSLAENKHLVKPRPAFHYRLPNCMVDEPNWSLAKEWNAWVAVERLACDPAKLLRMCRNFHEADDQSLRPFVDKWPDVLDGYMRTGI